MKSIIAPTDFSPASLNAVNYAAGIASVAGYKLVLLHIYPLPVMVGEVPLPVYGTDASEEYQEEKLENLRQSLLLQTSGKITIDTHAVQGDILLKIEGFCALLNPWAVVVGPETVGMIGEMLGGAVTAELMEELKWPVIIVPEKARFSDIKKIGLACDFRKVINTIPYKEITAIVKEFSGELHILHVHDGTGGLFDTETIEESGWLQEMFYNIQPKYHLISNNNIEEGIEQFAEENKLDMLIVVPKNHSVLHNIFLKSHSKKLAHHSKIPVLAVHE